MTTGTTEREAVIARILLEKQAVIINPTKAFIYTSGMKSPIYCDNRALLSFPDARDKIVDAMIHIMGREVQEFDIIAGVATAGIPWASIIADRLEKPLIYVRAKPKEHGRENLIEGKLESGQKVVVIEDLISTGGSSLKAIEAVEQAGGRVQYCIAVFTYEMQKAKEAFARNNCTLLTTTKFSVLAQEATVMKRITQEQKEMVVQWSLDPENWAKNNGFEE